MRIVHVHSDCTRSKGIPRSAVAIAEHSARLGHEVHYLHAYPGDAESPLFSRRQLPVITRPHFVEMLHFSRASARVCAQIGPDIIHSHGEVSFGDVVTAQSCHARAIAMRASSDAVRSFRNLGIVDAIRLRNERLLYREGRCRHVVAVSDGVRRELQEEYGVPSEKISVIPNGVDLSVFDLQKKSAYRGAVRAEQNIPQQDTLLLIVANEFERKGVRFVLEALGRLRRKNLWLLVSGNDDPAPFLHQARALGMEDHVRFLSVRAGIERLYMAADLFVMPTYYEAFSLAMVEAAAAGLPILMTRVNGAEEFVVDGVNGLFLRRDAGDVADKIESLLDDPGRRAAMSEQARQSAEPYNWPNIVGRVLSAYGRLTGGAK